MGGKIKTERVNLIMDRRTGRTGMGWNYNLEVRCRDKIGWSPEERER